MAFLLLVVLVPGIGKRINGARQWFDLGFAHLQPSEIAKLVFALWGAHMLALRERYMTTKSLLVPVLPVFGVLSLLLIVEPDFGAVVSLGLVLVGLLWGAGMPMKYFGWFAAVAAVLIAILIKAAPYRMARMTSFLDPFADPTNGGFQAVRGMYALATGGLWGVGLGNSAMKWDLLPHAESDYIFAIIGEELGFLGCLVVVTLYGVLAYAGFRIARRVGRSVHPVGQRGDHGLDRRPGGHEHGLRGRPAAGDRCAAAADLRRRDVAGPDAVHRRPAGPVRPVGAGGDRGGAQPRARPPRPAAPAGAGERRGPVRPRRRPEDRPSARPVGAAAAPSSAPPAPERRAGGRAPGPLRRRPPAARRPGKDRACPRPSSGYDGARTSGRRQPPTGAPRRAGTAVTAPLSVVLAGGGTGGHIEPMLALADALRRRADGGAQLRVTCLGRRGAWRPGWCRPAGTTCG